MNDNFDSMFEAYADAMEQESKSSNRGIFTPREYETIKFTGLETNKPKIIRAVGGPPDSKLDDSTARTVTISWIVGDDGKKFKVVRPSIIEDPNYILNKIISKVTAVKYGQNREKYYPVKQAYPDIYNKIEKNGLDETDPRVKYEKGWKGKEVLIMNVIDRAQMDWHREHKHTMILAKSINIGTNGAEFPDEGISSYAIGAKIRHLFKSYLSWQKYDIAITRTGNKDNPFILINATQCPMEVDASMRGFISQEPNLTAEEESWERYNLAKIYGYTSATKIYNRLKNTIKEIDVALKTHYLEDLQKQMEAEKAKWAEMYPQDNVENTTNTSAEPAPVNFVGIPAVDTPTEPTQSTAPLRARTAATATKEYWEELPYGNTLPEEFKHKITGLMKDSAGKISNIEWDYPIDQLAGCPTCGCPAPLDVTVCPNCNLSFV